jgi:hypothetical protein
MAHGLITNPPKKVRGRPFEKGRSGNPLGRLLLEQPIEEISLQICCWWRGCSYTTQFMIVGGGLWRGSPPMTPPISKLAQRWRCRSPRWTNGWLRSPLNSAWRSLGRAPDVALGLRFPIGRR